MTAKKKETGLDLSEHPVEALKRYNVEEGWHIVYPEPDELFIDIDDERDLGVLQEMVRTLKLNDISVEIVRSTPSATAGHYHIVARLAGFGSLDATTRIAFQACLGSDRKRELLSLLRVVLKMSRPPTVFFEKNEETVDDDDIPF